MCIVMVLGFNCGTLIYVYLWLCCLMGIFCKKICDVCILLAIHECFVMVTNASKEVGHVHVPHCNARGFLYVQVYSSKVIKSDIIMLIKTVR